MSPRSLCSSRWFVPLALVAAIAGAGYAFTPRSAPVTYKTATAERGDVVRRVSTVGTLQPVRLIDVGSQVSGQVAELLVDYNSEVKAGQVLARIDPTQLEARLRQAEADLAKARANVEASDAAIVSAEVTLADARRTEKRSAELIARKLVPQSELDTAVVNVRKAEAELNSKRAALAQAQAGVVQAEAAVTDARTNRENAVIKAPVDGVVISRAVNVGQTLASNFQAPVLFQIAQDLREMQLEASVDEADIGAIKVGQRVSFSVDAYPDRVFSGSVREIRLVATTTSNVVTYTVVIAVDNQDRSLLPGMTANASVETANQGNVLRVPNMALRFKPDPALDRMPERPAGAGTRNRDAGGETAQAQPGAGGSAGRTRVWSLAEDGHLKPIPVKLGVSDDKYTEVIGGKLEPGMTVIVGRQSAAAARPGESTPPPPPGGPR